MQEPVRGMLRSDRIRLWEGHVAGDRKWDAGKRAWTALPHESSDRQAAAAPVSSRRAAAASLSPVALQIAGVLPWEGATREGFAGLSAEWRAGGGSVTACL